MFLLTPVAWPIAKLLLACAAAGRAQRRREAFGWLFASLNCDAKA